jgi:DNA-binding NarL/FixJ family response regulator
VVEDDDSFAAALRERLEADGRLEVAGRAREGREAIELAEALRPDVVLMDVVLPVMDGVEATREIRRRQPTIAVVGVTGSEYEERALEVRDAGAVDFVRRGRLDPDLVDIVARHSAPALTRRILNSKATAGGTPGRVRAVIAAVSRMRA